MDKLILVSGVRLSNKGLHLGHYLGCFTPLTYFSPHYVYYFVINDVSNVELNKLDKEDLLIDMVGDILSVDTPKNIRIFLQSDILMYQSDFYSKIQKITTFNQLVAVHPHSKGIKTGNSGLTVLDFLFPIRDAVVFLALEADYVLMNDDNSRIIDFTRKTSNKLNNILSSNRETRLFKTPYLKTGVYPRLLGYDYRKMCNGYDNAIYLTEDPQLLKVKVEKLVNTKYFNLFLQNKFKDNIPNTDIELNNLFTPKIVNELLGDTSLNFKFEKNSKGNYNLSGNSAEIKGRVFNIIEQSLFKFRTKKEVFENKKDIILAKLRDDNNYLQFLMKEFKRKPF